MNSKVILACVLVELGLLIGADGVRPLADSEANTSHTRVTPTVSMTTLREVPNGNRLVTYALTIPVVHGIPGLQEHLNADVRSTAEKEARNATKAPQQGPATFDLTSRVWSLTSDVYSIELHWNKTPMEGGRQVESSATRTYWLKDGGTVGLANLFLPGRDEAVHRSIVSHMRMVDGTRIGEYDLLVNDNELIGLADQSFVLTPHGIRFIFDPCEVAACAAYIVTSEVPYSEVRDLIDPSGPLATHR